MNIHKYIFTHFTLFLIIGIILGSYFSFPIIYIICCSFILITFLIFLKWKSNKQYHHSYIFTITALLLFTLIGIINSSLQKPSNDDYSYFLEENRPQNILIEISTILSTNKKYQRAYGKVICINNKPCSGKIAVTLKKSTPITIGQQLLANTFISTISPPTNPHQFNYKGFLKKNSIYHQCFLKENDYKVIRTHKSIFYYVSQAQKKISTIFESQAMGRNELAIVKALLLGNRQSILKNLKQSYANAGAIHILAISGLHVGIIWWILGLLFAPLRRGKYGTVFVTTSIISCLWLYALFAGMSASVVRAVTMFTFISIGNNSNRNIKTIHSLIVSMFLLLLIHPSFLFSVGFQMSYAAVFGILWIQPKLYQLWNPSAKIIQYFWKITTISIAAQIAVLPLSIYYFHQFPGLFILSNWVIIPCLKILLTLGFLLCILALLSILPSFLTQIYSYIISFLNEFVEWISSQEAFLFKNISFSLINMLLFYGLIICFFLWYEKKTFRRTLTLLLLIISIQVHFIFDDFNINKKNEWIVFQASNKSIEGFRNGRKLLHNNTKNSHQFLIEDYALGEHISKIEDVNFPNYIEYANHKILIVDSLAYYQYRNINPDIILLKKSPKIHLGRLIKTLHPTLIIADGSNYRSFVERWHKSCEKEKTPFYDISKKGAYILSL